MKGPPFVCDMSVIEPSMRSKHIETIKKVFHSVNEIKEISNGFTFRLPNDSNILINLMSFVEKERLCCPFFGFSIDIEPEGGNVWLKINGREGVKEFIKAEFEDVIKFPRDESF